MKKTCVLMFLMAFNAAAPGTEMWKVFETSWETAKVYANPFTDVEVSVVFQKGDARWTVPAFWAGGKKWTVRFAPPAEGEYQYRVVCTDSTNEELNGRPRSLRVTGYRGNNPLFKHGFVQVSENKRHFEHADGTPFFWLGDTWWKGLCRRLTWEGFKELTADRKAKGFTLVQIVCGPYPDEGMLEPRWENEGGMPYRDPCLSIVNPDYFNYADRRLYHLVEAGIVPAIVGGWGREQAGGKSTLAVAGVEGYKRHWRHLVARYGALPVIWIVGGEAGDWQGPWSEVAKYLKLIDPYRHPITFHSPGDPQQTIKDNAAFDFDMIALGHDGLNTAAQTLKTIKSSLARVPARPVLCGEACYEGHMQTNFQDLQRYLFWSFLLNGAAGFTYGAAGIWHASVEGDPGITPIYDYTTWTEGMHYPGSGQLGLGKKLLAQYKWWQFEVHPEWSDSVCFSAGIPGEARFIYQPKQGIYNWNGPRMLNLEHGVVYRAFYFDPATGRRYDRGTVKNSGEWQKEIRMPVPSPQDWLLVLERVQQ